MRVMETMGPEVMAWPTHKYRADIRPESETKKTSNRQVVFWEKQAGNMKVTAPGCLLAYELGNPLRSEQATLFTSFFLAGKLLP